MQGEYTGDLVTQDEAERRGRVYDMMDLSYLFSANEQWAIDAQKNGNKLRCAPSRSASCCWCLLLPWLPIYTYR